MTAAEEQGRVVVPLGAEAGVFTAVMRYVSERVRDGGTLSPQLRTFLRDLHQSASAAPDASTSSEGRVVGGLEILGAHEVADILGCSRRWATALLGSGRLRAWQVGGRTWVTTRGDLDAYRYGRTEEHSGKAQAHTEGGQADRPDQAADTVPA